MKIIKSGNTKEFNCECGCIFQCDDDDYEEHCVDSYVEFWYETVYCPECNNRISQLLIGAEKLRSVRCAYEFIKRVSGKRVLKEDL